MKNERNLPKKSAQGAPSSSARTRARRTPVQTVKPRYNGTGVHTGSEMRRPKARRSPSQMTAEIGRIEPKKIKKNRNFLYGIIGNSKVQTVKVKTKSFPWQEIVVAAACTLIVMVLVLDYVRLNEYTNRYADMQNEIIDLISDRKTLTLTLEQKNDLLDFEEKAKSLGMVQSDKVEKRYISSQNEDKIEVPEGAGNKVKKFFGDVASKVSEYFRNIFSR